MIRALIYLRVHAIKNRLRTRLRRLKEPKYLIGGIVGLVYLWAFVLKNLISGRFGPEGKGPALAPSAELQDLIEAGGAWLVLALMVGFWIVPSRRAALDFTEAEIQFLFPAPVSRRGLVHYKLLSWQFGLLFASLVVSFFSGRLFRMDGGWMAVLGWWLALLFLQLHAVGASFARTLLLQRGFPHWQRRLAAAAVLAALVGATVWWGWRSLPPMPALDAWEPEVLRDWFETLSATAPMVWVLTPLRWVTRLAVTRDAVQFVQALPLALALVVLHYIWVVRSNVAFEEASVEAAQATADRLAAARGGRHAVRPSGSRKRRRHLFELRPIGAPWVALGWKNLVAAGAIFRGRSLVMLAVMLVPAMLVGSSLARGTNAAVVIGFLSALLLGMSVLIGPVAARFDLRLDLANAADVLKAQPLLGWQVILGELFAPCVLLSAIEWGLALVAAVFLPGLPGGIELGIAQRLVLLASASVLAPAFSLVGLCLQNAAVLLFPAWVLMVPGQARGGFEMMGQQMIVVVGQMVAFLVALAPAALAGATVFALLAWGVGPWLAALPAALAVTAVLLAETAVAVYAMGLCWDRSDLSREQAP